MEIPGLSQLFGLSQSAENTAQVVCLDSTFIKQHGRRREMLKTMINGLGNLSMIAQGLGTAVTSISILEMHPDQRLYVAIDTNSDMAIGLLKVGLKRLFVTRLSGSMSELETLCVLDFYTHESRQRQGIGYLMMSVMLQRERYSSKVMGYDRPSNKLLNFLAKHFSLIEYVPQANNFVVYEAAFDEERMTKRGSRYTPPPAASLEQIQRAITPAGRQFYGGGLDPVAAQADRKARYVNGGGRMAAQNARAVVSNNNNEYESSPLALRAHVDADDAAVAYRQRHSHAAASPLPTSSLSQQQRGYGRGGGRGHHGYADESTPTTSTTAATSMQFQRPMTAPAPASPSRAHAYAQDQAGSSTYRRLHMGADSPLAVSAEREVSRRPQQQQQQQSVSMSGGGGGAVGYAAQYAQKKEYYQSQPPTTTSLPYERVAAGMPSRREYTPPPPAPPQQQAAASQAQGQEMRHLTPAELYALQGPDKIGRVSVKGYVVNHEAPRRELRPGMGGRRFRG